MKFTEFLENLDSYDGGINRGVKINTNFLSEFSQDAVNYEDVDKLESFTQICGNIVQKNDLPVEILRLKDRSVLFIDFTDGESIDVDLEDVSYVCVKVSNGTAGELNLKGSDLNNCFLEGLIEADSSLVINLDICESETVWVSRIKLGKGSELTYKVADLNVKNGYFDIKNFLEGRSAKADVEWVYLNSGNGMKNAYVANYFQDKDCNGEILVKGVQEDKSKVTFLGEINISLEGGGTDSYLKEDVMILDESSYIEAIPSLEIKTNDVKAGHGVSISKITEDKLFYLKSRGIDEREAKNLIRQGFLKAGYERFGDDVLVEKLDRIVTAVHE